MTGGSQEPEHALDAPCQHCGLYYMDRGNALDMHELNCPERGGDSNASQKASTSTDEVSTDGQGENPAKGSPDPEARSGPSKACPECGGDLVEDTEFVVDGQTHTFDETHYGCGTCKVAWEEDEL